MLTILYQESREANHPAIGGDWQDIVSVELRSWSHQDRYDIILESRVRVDGEWITRHRAAFNGLDHTTAELQRLAIQRFDELLAAHPAPEFRDSP